MGRYPKTMLKKGPWSKEEDEKLAKFIESHDLKGITWETISNQAGLNRCGKSCRSRWKNYLSPHITRGNFSEEEESIIIDLHSRHGNKWAQIASQLPGRTDNEIKNFWNTKLKKKLAQKSVAIHEYHPSQPQIPTVNDDNYYLTMSILSKLLLGGSLNLPQSDVAVNLLLQAWEFIRKQQEMLIMAPIPDNPFLPDELNAAGNYSNTLIPFEYHPSSTSDACFQFGGYYDFHDSGNILYGCNNDLTQYCVAPAASSTDHEVPLINPMIGDDDEFIMYANIQNPSTRTNFEHEMTAVDLGSSAMHAWDGSLD